MPKFQDQNEKEDITPINLNLRNRRSLSVPAIAGKSLEGVKVRFDQSKKFSSNVDEDIVPINLNLSNGRSLSAPVITGKSLEGVKVDLSKSGKSSPNSNNESDLMSVEDNSKELDQKQEYLSKLFTPTSHKKTQNILQQLGYDSSDVSELSRLIEFNPKQAQPVQRKFNSKRAEPVPKMPNILEQKVSIPKKGKNSKKVPCRIKWRKEDESDKGATLIGVEGPKIIGSGKKKTANSCKKNEILKERLPKDLGVDQQSLVDRLRGYVLNPDHDAGKSKGKLFESLLGVKQENAEEFATTLESKNPFNVEDLVNPCDNGHGITAQQHVNLRGLQGEPVWVRIAWMADYETGLEGQVISKDCKTPWRAITVFIETNPNKIEALEKKGKTE